MSEFRQFGSFEEMQEWMRLNEEFANRVTTTDAQRAIEPGDYVVRPYDMSGVPLLIVGKTFTIEEFLEGEHDAGADVEELAEIAIQMSSIWSRGYRTARWYSVLEPAGEYGDAHISVLHKTTQERYEQYLKHIQQGVDPFSLWYAHQLTDKEK